MEVAEAWIAHHFHWFLVSRLVVEVVATTVAVWAFAAVVGTVEIVAEGRRVARSFEVALVMVACQRYLTLLHLQKEAVAAGRAAAVVGACPSVLLVATSEDSTRKEHILGTHK